MPLNRSLPPLEFCRGTSPSHAANWRPFLNADGSGTVAASAEAVIGSMPGIVARLQLASSDLCQVRIRRSSASIRLSHSSIWSAICQRARRANSGISVLSRPVMSSLTLRRPCAATIPNSAMSLDSVDQHGALAHQQIACPVQHQDGLLLFVLDRHEYHVRPHQGLDDGGCVIGVVLLAALDVWLDLGWRDQPHLMAQRRDPASPVMRRGTRLHADDAGRQRFEKCFHASAAKLPAQHRSPGLVDRMDLKNVFGEIKTYNSNRHLNSLRNVALRLRPS